jgi:hypothetical protein
MPAGDEIATLFFLRAEGKTPALAGAALAVAVGHLWIELVLNVEDPREREKLKEAWWDLPLAERDKNEWLSLTARLVTAADDNAAVLREFRGAMALMRTLADDGHDGRVQRYDNVVISAMRGARDAAKAVGFRLEAAGRAELVITIVDGITPRVVEGGEANAPSHKAMEDA